MELVKLTKGMLNRITQKIDDYIDFLYLDTSKLSKAKVDFLGEVRNYIITNKGIGIANPDRWIQSIGGATSGQLGGIKARYYAAAQIDFGHDLELFIKCLTDMEDWGLDPDITDYIINLTNKPELPLRILQEISNMLNEYKADWWKTRNEKGQFEYSDWVFPLEEMVEKVKKVVEGEGYNPDASKVEDETFSEQDMTLEEMGLDW